MAERKVFLKVKLKSLAAESRVIKREEQRRKVPARRTPRVGKIASDEVKHWARCERTLQRGPSVVRRAQPWYPMSAQELHELTRHRLDVVRVEARLTAIAYAIIRGRNLVRVDSLDRLKVKDWERVQTMLKKYGDADEPVTKAVITMKPQDIEAYCRAAVLAVNVAA